MDKRFLLLLLFVISAAGLTLAVAMLVTPGPDSWAIALPVTMVAALLAGLYARKGN